MRALEQESGVEADELGEDASFLRNLVLDGRWDDALTLLEVSSISLAKIQRLHGSMEGSG